MNQIEHGLVAQVIVSVIWHLFLRDYLRVRAEDEYWTRIVDNFFNKYINKFR